MKVAIYSIALILFLSLVLATAFWMINSGNFLSILTTSFIMISAIVLFYIIFFFLIGKIIQEL